MNVLVFKHCNCIDGSNENASGCSTGAAAVRLPASWDRTLN